MGQANGRRLAGGARLPYGRARPARVAAGETIIRPGADADDGRGEEDEHADCHKHHTLFHVDLLFCVCPTLPAVAGSGFDFAA